MLVDKTDFSIPLDGFFSIEPDVAIKILKDDSKRFVWYLTINGEFYFNDAKPAFKFKYRKHYEYYGGDEVILYYNDNYERNKHTVMYTLSQLAHRVNFHIKPENIFIFMLKYGGIIKKSPAYVYKNICIGTLDD